VFKAGLTVVRLGDDSDTYPRVTCCRYPACHELTLKVFVHHPTFNIDQCLSMILDELTFTNVDNLIIAFDEAIDQATIDAIWADVTTERKTSRAGAIGVADFCLHKLKQLRGATPDIDQVAPDKKRGYCGISSDLVEYAKERGIKLRSHGDEANMRADEVNEVLPGRHVFTARYSQSSKDRLALTKRGFFHYVELC